MNQLNDAETGNADTPEQIGATGGFPAVNEPVLPPAVIKQEPNMNIVNEYNSFNLANVMPPVPLKWKTSDTLLDDFRKFRTSCQCIFDKPMHHITSGKVKTSMLLIWAGPDGEEIYENFNLPVHQKYDVDFVLNKFEAFCEPICNFRIACFKFSKVHQYQGELIDVFYNHILKIPKQCEFSNTDERVIDAIIFRTHCTKAQDKLLQTPKTLSLQQCLSVCRHYESLHLHIQHIRPDKSIDYLRKHHQGKKKSGSQSSNTKQDESENQRQRSQSRSHSSQNTQGKLSHSQCFGCGHDKHASRSDCPAMGKVCHKCGCENHFESVCGRIPYFRRRSKLHGRK